MLHKNSPPSPHLLHFPLCLLFYNCPVRLFIILFFFLSSAFNIVCIVLCTDGEKNLKGPHAPILNFFSSFFFVHHYHHTTIQSSITLPPSSIIKSNQFYSIIFTGSFCIQRSYFQRTNDYNASSLQGHHQQLEQKAYQCPSTEL